MYNQIQRLVVKQIPKSILRDTIKSISNTTVVCSYMLNKKSLTFTPQNQIGTSTQCNTYCKSQFLTPILSSLGIPCQFNLQKSSDLICESNESQQNSNNSDLLDLQLCSKIDIHQIIEGLVIVSDFTFEICEKVKAKCK